MSAKDAWLADLAQLAGRHAATHDAQPAAMLVALCELDALMLRALTPARVRYAALAEADIRQGVPAAIDALGAGSLAWPSGDIMLAAAVQIRALDRYLLADGRSGLGPPADVNADYRCGDFHVIPRRRITEPPAQAMARQPYTRRGLFYHRIIPVQPDGIDLWLHWYPDLAAGGLDPVAGASLGAAFFTDMTLVAQPDIPGFVAIDAPCSDAAGDLRTHCREAFVAGCLAVVWPELSMPPDRLAQLKHGLRDEAERHEPGVGPSMIVPGSWHEKDGGIVHNVTRVLARSGRERIVLAKTLPLDTAKVHEAIEPSFAIHLLVNEDVLVAFAICRDFCEARLSKAFALLPVDLVIVPSYGNERTLLGHRDQAKTISLAHDARTFVVQHPDPGNEVGPGIGYVLPPVREPDRLTAPAMLVDATFSTHPVEFKAC